ncbi:MAG: radical SAM protein [Rhizomicrobium sp.]|jgi:organic radical activating enzyme
MTGTRDQTTTWEMSVKSVRTLLTELDAVVTGLAVLSKRFGGLQAPDAQKISAQLAVLVGRINLDQAAIWQLEAVDSGILSLMEDFASYANLAEIFAGLNAFIDKIRLLLSMLSHKVETLIDHDQHDVGQIVAKDNVRAKHLNRKLLAYEVASGRVVLRSAPLRHIVHTTTKCNLRCLTCFQSASQDAIHHDLADVPFDALEPAIQLAQQVMIAGTGEPLLSRSAPSLIARYKREGAYVEVITNGTTLSRTLRLLSAVDVVLLSFDGGNAESYNAVRRWGNFEKLVARIGELAAEHRKKICLNFVVTKQNVYSLEDCLKLAARLRLGQAHFQEMNAYLPWHDRMTIDSTDRAWFFRNFDAWTAKAGLAGVHAINHLVPPIEIEASPLPTQIEAISARNIAAVRDVPVAEIPSRLNLVEVSVALDEILREEMPAMLAPLAQAAAKLRPVRPLPPSFRNDPAQALRTEQVSLSRLIWRREAMFPHCISTYAQLLINEDGTTRPCCKVQSRLASTSASDFGEIRNSQPNIALRAAHVAHDAGRKECIACRDPMRFHFLVELLEELKNDGIPISQIRKPEDFVVPASIASHPLVKELGSLAANDAAPSLPNAGSRNSVSGKFLSADERTRAGANFACGPRYS